MVLHMLTATGSSPGELSTSRRRKCLVTPLYRVVLMILTTDIPQVVEKVNMHYEDKRLYHIKNDPMKIIVHYDASIDR